MKLNAVVSRVRSIAGDFDSLQFTDSQLLEWVNDGIRECALNNNLLQKSAVQNTSVGSSQYSLPDDILKLYSIRYNGSKLPILTLEEFDKRYTGGQTSTSNDTPIVCYVWAGSLHLYPSPSQEQALTVDYIYYPETLAESDTDKELPLPVGYHSRIVDYCLAQVAQQDDDINRYNSKMQEFLTGVQLLKDQPEYSEDLYPSISVSARDMGGQLYEDF